MTFMMGFWVVLLGAVVYIAVRLAQRTPTMMMNCGLTLEFTRKGIYRLGTKTVQMPGGGMDVKTVGPDNHLRLMVAVA